MNAAALALPIAPLALCVAAETAVDTGFKIATDRATKNGDATRALLRDGVFWLTLLCGGAEIVLWIYALQNAPLSIAYSVMTLAYVTVPLSGILFLKERMTAKQAIGAVFITAGVALVSLAP